MNKQIHIEAFYEFIRSQILNRVVNKNNNNDLAKKVEYVNRLNQKNLPMLNIGTFKRIILCITWHQTL